MLEDKNKCVGLLTLSEAEQREVFRKEPITDVYDVEDTVFARGKFANVRKATHKVSGVQYAAKYIKKRRRAATDQTPEIHHEIAVLLKCGSNGRVVRLHEVYESKTDVILMLELAAGGELQQIIDRDEVLVEAEAKRTMRQILEGLAFLHESNIAHLDIKPQNILLSEENNFDDIKLCDFGISRILEPGSKIQAILGTTDYVSPEILSYEPITLAADIWSIGVLGYVLLSGLSPFGGDTKQHTYCNISQCSVTFDKEDFPDVSSSAIDFIRAALVVDPRKRPTVHQLLQHPWLSLPQPTILTPTIISFETAVPPNQQRTSNDPISRALVESESLTPKMPRKSSNFENSSPNSQPNGTYSPEAAVRSYNCLCSQCGTTCRHLQTPVAKPPITVDRGILC